MLKWLCGIALSIVVPLSYATEMPSELRGKVIKYVVPTAPGSLSDTRSREVLELVSKAKTRKEKVAVLQKHNHPALKDIIRVACDDDVVSLLPEGTLEFKYSLLIKSSIFNNRVRICLSFLSSSK